MKDPDLKQTPADILAVLLSWVLNPLLTPAAVFALLLYQFGATPNGIFHGTLIALGFFFVIPGLGILWLRKKGMIDSFDIRSKEKRAIPLMLGLACNIAAIYVISTASFPTQALILISAISFLVAGIAIFFITRSWKISIHLTIYAAVFCALLSIYFNWPAELVGERGMMEIPTWLTALIVIGAPALMWARVHCKVHTTSQVLVGFLFGCICYLSGYWILASAL